MSKPIHLLYLTAEQWPTFRPDVLALFGKYLPRHGITCDLVTEHSYAHTGKPAESWGAGELIVCDAPRSRAGQYVAKLWHNLRILATAETKKYTAIQVRDMTVAAVVGLLMARIKGIKFYYWLSYPQSEGQIDRARSRGLSGGMRFWFPLLQGYVGKWLLYKLVLPNADHVFVQSRQMQLDVAKHGIPVVRMTPVPMGVDTELANIENVVPSTDPRLHGKRVVAYLGTLDPIRQIDVLLQMTALVKISMPEILLVVVGDTDDVAHMRWLKEEAERLQICGQVLWVGWLPASSAWSYMRSAEIGFSPIPRGYLLDMGSPTKTVEYMALGLPVIGNENPDQAQLIAESGAGLCVPLEVIALANAVVALLNDPLARKSMGDKGPVYVAESRSYDKIARSVAAVYQNMEETECAT